MIQKDVFWKAAIFTLVVFVLGVLLGYFLESHRISAIEKGYKRVEIEWADAKLQSTYYQLMSPFFCDAAIKENLIFADKIYDEGLKLEKYESANKLSNEMLVDKQRYALLKVEFWLNSISLKEKCEANYTNLVYFYLNKPTLTQKAAQDTQAIILKELKEKHGDEVMLIPLPIDLGISTINIIKEAYNINEVPTLLINEEVKLEGIHSLSEIEAFL